MSCLRLGLPSVVLGLAGMLTCASALRADLNEDFNNPDLSTNTPVTLEFFNSDPGPFFGVQDFGGNPGGFFQVTTDGVNDNRNYAYFDRTAMGAYESINFSFDLKIGPRDASADGGSISFISTAIFGENGGVAQSAFNVPEDPAQVGVLGIGFDTWANTGIGDQQESNGNPVFGGNGGDGSLYNDVTLYWNNNPINQFVNPDPTMRDILPNGIRIDDDVWHTVEGSIDFVNQKATMTIDGLEVWNNIDVPGLVPFESRVMLGARTGGENENFGVDNLVVNYVGETADGFGPADLQPAPTQGNWSVREWNIFSPQVNGTAGADAIINDPAFNLKVFISDGMSEIINFADPQNPGGGYSIPIAKQPFFSNSAGDDNDVVMRAIARVIIPEDGQYTFGIDGDDGTRLTLEGANFTGSPNNGGGIVVSGNRLEHPANTGNAFGLASTFMAAGEYDIELVWQERGGGAFVEVFAAPGIKESLDATFSPVGLREDIPVGQGTLPTTTGDWNVRSVQTVPTRPLNNLADAQAAIDLGDNDPDVLFSIDTMSDVINYNDPDTNGTGAGRFRPDDFFPIDLVGNDDNDFATMASVIVSIPEDNDYIFGFGSDDGASLTLSGANFTILNPGGPRAVTNDGQTMEFNANTGNSDTFGTTFLAAGEYELSFLTWERGGGAWAEVYTGVGSEAISILTARLLGSPEEVFDLVIPAGLQLGGEPPVGGVVGDYNNSGQVEQGDLDLVLLNWGDALVAPWVTGIVDQAELDTVLLNWGNTAALGGAGAVPEPSTIALLLIAAGLGYGLIRKR